MKRHPIVMAILTLAGLLLMGQANALDTMPSHYTVLIDISKSNPMVDDSAYAAQIARDVVAHIHELAFGDFVTIATFGDFDPVSNPVVIRKVTTKYRPDVALRSLGTMIAQIPGMIAGGKLQAQQTTNIVASLESTARRLDCTRERAVVFVLTDGREDSAYGKMPPLEQEPIFAGCQSLIFIGVLGKTPKETKELGAAWMDWCDRSGFVRCDYR